MDSQVNNADVNIFIIFFVIIKLRNTLLTLFFDFAFSLLFINLLIIVVVLLLFILSFLLTDITFELVSLFLSWVLVLFFLFFLIILSLFFFNIFLIVLHLFFFFGDFLTFVFNLLLIFFVELLIFLSVQGCEFIFLAFILPFRNNLEKWLPHKLRILTHVAFLWFFSIFCNWLLNLVFVLSGLLWSGSIGRLLIVIVEIFLALEFILNSVPSPMLVSLGNIGVFLLKPSFLSIVLFFSTHSLWLLIML